LIRAWPVTRLVHALHAHVQVNSIDQYASSKNAFQL
jgi:hypothetical protein